MLPAQTLGAGRKNVLGRRQAGRKTLEARIAPTLRRIAADTPIRPSRATMSIQLWQLCVSIVFLSIWAYIGHLAIRES